jgi:hypothetical protein
MNASKTLTIYLIGGLILGAIAGYGVGYLTYQPKISQLQSDLLQTQDQLEEAQVMISQLEAQISELTTKLSIEVTPTYMDDVIPGQVCVFLVSITTTGGDDDVMVEISATAEMSEVTVYPGLIQAGQVAEVSVIPDEDSVDHNLTITIKGKLDSKTKEISAAVNVLESPPFIGELEMRAIDMRDRFIPWLSVNHPEFGITDETEWVSTTVRPHFMVVMFHLFFSEEWEMGVSWHVMIPPSDWARIYLRHRYDETHPSYAFEISSLEGNTEPKNINIEAAFAETIWR